MEQCLPATGTNIYLIAVIAILAILVGGMLLYAPLRKRLGLFTLVFALAGIFSYTTPAFAAAADDCTGGGSKVSSTTPSNPATPTNPQNPDPEEPACIPAEAFSCSDTRVRLNGASILSCNAQGNGVNEWTVTLGTDYKTEEERQKVSLGSGTDDPHTLDKPDKGFRAVYNPKNDQLTVTITDASLYPAPPAVCGPCEDSQAPVLFDNGSALRTRPSGSPTDFTFYAYSNGCVLWWSVF